MSGEQTWKKERVPRFEQQELIHSAIACKHQAIRNLFRDLSSRPSHLCVYTAKKWKNNWKKTFRWAPYPALRSAVLVSVCKLKLIPYQRHTIVRHIRPYMSLLLSCLACVWRQAPPPPLMWVQSTTLATSQHHGLWTGYLIILVWCNTC